MISTPIVMAGTGGLAISPQWPVMVESPATFSVWAKSADVYDVNVLLVTTQEVYDAFSATAITLTSGTATVLVQPGDFVSATGTGNEYVPPSGTTNGARYTVASLKDHLSYNLSEPLDSDDVIYWVMFPLNDSSVFSGSFDDRFDPLTTVPEEITLELHSSLSNPRMLIYLLGNSVDDAELFDVKVPPTNPGFMVPEIAMGSIMAVSTMFAALGLYAYRKKHQATKITAA